MTVTVVSIKGPYPYASDVYNFIGQRWLKLESCNFHPMTLVSSWLTSLRNAKGNIGAGASNDRGVRKMRYFQPISGRISETVRDKTKVNRKWRAYTLSIGTKIINLELL